MNSGRDSNSYCLGAVGDDLILKAIRETCKLFEIYFKIVEQITGSRFADLMCNSVNEDLYLVDLAISAAATVDF